MSFQKPAGATSPFSLQSNLRGADQWDAPSSSFLWPTLLPGPSGGSVTAKDTEGQPAPPLSLGQGLRCGSPSIHPGTRRGQGSHHLLLQCSPHGKDGVGKEEWGEISFGRSADGQKLQGWWWHKQSRGNTHRPGRWWAAGWSTGETGGEGPLPGRWLELEMNGDSA